MKNFMPEEHPKVEVRAAELIEDELDLHRVDAADARNRSLDGQAVLLSVFETQIPVASGAFRNGLTAGLREVRVTPESRPL